MCSKATYCTTWLLVCQKINGHRWKGSTNKLMHHKTVQKGPIMKQMMYFKWLFHLWLCGIVQQAVWRSLQERYSLLLEKNWKELSLVDIRGAHFYSHKVYRNKLWCVCFTCPGCSQGVWNSACWQVSLTFLYLGRLLVCWVFTESSFFLRIFLHNTSLTELRGNWHQQINLSRESIYC